MLAMSAASLLTPHAADAATFTWNQTGAGPFAWDDPANWLPAGFPNAIGDIALLNAADLTGNQVINMTSAIVIGQLQLGDFLGNSTYTIAAGGGSLAFDVTSGSALLAKNHGGLNIATLAGMDTISTGVLLSDNLIINNSIAGQGINLTGIIDDIANPGRSITKEGAGFVQLGSLGGPNNFSGGVIVNAGRLAVSLGNGAAGSGAITLNTGAQFDILNDAALTLANNFIIRGNSVINVSNAIGGTAAANTAHVISGSLTLNNNTLVVAQAGAYNLTFTGAVNLLGKTSTFSNAATNPVITLGSAGIGAITGAGALNKVGAGQLILANTSATGNSYTGGTNVFAGNLTINAGTITALGSGAVYVAPGAVLRLNDGNPFTGPAVFSIQSTLVALSNISQSPTGAVNTAPGANTLGILDFGTDFAIGALAGGVRTSPILGAVLRTNGVAITNAVNMANVDRKSTRLNSSHRH